MAVGLSAAPAAPVRSGLPRGLTIFLWLLPFHVAAMALLFGYLGLPGPTVRVVAAWKEMLVLTLAALAVGRALTGRGSRAQVHALDLAVAGLLFYAVWFLVGAGGWYGRDDVPLVARLYGLRDAGIFLLLYFVGRATPSVAENTRVLRILVTVGVVTSVIAVLEWLLVSPATLVVLGAARYFREFLGVALATATNDYGLPGNYWTIIGDQLVRRVGSTYLSSQGFAVPFLVIVPAATLWVTAVRRRRVLAWGAYALVWVALLLTITRMTIVACLLQTVLIAGMRRRWSLAVTIGTAGLTVFVVLAALFPGVVLFAWNTLTWQSGSSVSHLEDWREGLVNLVEHPLGAGLGTADQVAMRFGLNPLAYDNQYLTYGVELGIPGLALFVAVLAGGIAAGVRAWRSAAEPVRSYGVLAAVTGFGILVNALTAAVFNSMLLSYVFFWLVGSVITATDQAAAASPEP